MAGKKNVMIDPIRLRRKISKARLIQGRDPVSQLYRASLRYLESRSGSAVVIGGVVVVEEPGRPATFILGVRITGKQPVKDDPPGKKKSAEEKKPQVAFPLKRRSKPPKMRAKNAK